MGTAYDIGALPQIGHLERPHLPEPLVPVCRAEPAVQVRRLEDGGQISGAVTIFHASSSLKSDIWYRPIRIGLRQRDIVPVEHHGHS